MHSQTISLYPSIFLGTCGHHAGMLLKLTVSFDSHVGLAHVRRHIIIQFSDIHIPSRAARITRCQKRVLHSELPHVICHTLNEYQFRLTVLKRKACMLAWVCFCTRACIKVHGVDGACACACARTCLVLPRRTRWPRGYSWRRSPARSTAMLPVAVCHGHGHGHVRVNARGCESVHRLTYACAQLNASLEWISKATKACISASYNWPRPRL